MNTIKIILDYGCFPIWVYDENGIYIDNKIPDDMPNRKSVEAAFIQIQWDYEMLFINNKFEFTYIGFTNNEKKAEFTKHFNTAVELLNKSADDKYNIVNTVDVKKL